MGFCHVLFRHPFYVSRHQALIEETVEMNSFLSSTQKSEALQCNFQSTDEGSSQGFTGQKIRFFIHQRHLNAI